MSIFNEIEIYTPKSENTSKWEINSRCSYSTKLKLNRFLKKCDEFEKFLSEMGVNINYFYWNTADDDLRLDLEFDNMCQKIINKNESLIRSYVYMNFETLYEGIDDLFDDPNSHTQFPLIKCYKSLEVDTSSPLYDFPSTDYFYASMW